jgi:hypothetical protein
MAVCGLPRNTPPVGLLKVTFKVLFGSFKLLFTIGMVKSLICSPAAKLSVPDVSR